MTDTKKIDLEQAKTDPASAFSSPQEVVDHPALSRAQKIDILERWKFDADELAVASEEGMAGGEPSLLREVSKALDALDGNDPSSPDPHVKS